jgi:hypothetical protein
MSAVETLLPVNRPALSLYCPIPVVIEQQQIHAFRSAPTLRKFLICRNRDERRGVESLLCVELDDDYRVEIKSSVIDTDRSVRGCHRAVIGSFYILPRHDFELGRASANFSVPRVFLAFPFPRTTIPHPKIVVTPVSR